MSKRIIALYSPYIPKHSGGGERHLLSIAQTLSEANEVFLLVSGKKIKETEDALLKYEQTFGLNLSKVKVKSTLIGSGRNPLGILNETRQYDALFAMTDGSIFPTLAKKSYLIIQIPWTRKLAFSERLKLKSWAKVLVYSEFVKAILQKSWGIEKIQVLSPYIAESEFERSVKKEKIIVSVGRFFAHNTSNSKRQDVLVEAFKQFVDQGHKDWQLILAGNIDPNPDSLQFVYMLRELADSYPIRIETDLTYTQLKDLYARAKIYWHAAGFNVDEEKNPENTEHFGITTLEAIAAGCIPLVVPRGGQREVVGSQDFFWETRDELVKKTVRLAQSVQPEILRSRLKVYSKSRFESEVERLL